MGKEFLGDLELNRIYQMDCLEGMRLIPNKSIGMILCDPPYGTTASKWDKVLPFDDVWKEYKRIIRDNGAIILFGSEPFSTYLRMSNIEHYKYDWIWYKNMPTGFTQAKNKPLKDYENIMVFSKGTTVHASQSKNRMTYNPQGLKDVEIVKSNDKKFGNLNGQRPSHKANYTQNKAGYPRMVLTDYPLDKEKLHPTQKPLKLCEYLIATYSNENDIILDNCMGSGTTAVAALQTGRIFIGFETETEYIEKANKRLDNLKIN